MTRGSVFRHLVGFSWPIFAGGLLHALYSAVDAFWVGNFLGGAGLASVSVCFPLVFGASALVMGLSMAATALVSQLFGAGMWGKLREVCRASVLLSAALGLFAASALAFLGGPLLSLLGVSPRIMGWAKSYLSLIALGLPFAFVYQMGSALCRGLGDSRRPLLFLAFASALNVVLDPLLIGGVGGLVPPMGVVGAALATSASQALSAALSLRHLWRSGLVNLLDLCSLPDRSISALLFRIGLPASLQQLLVSLGHAFLMSFVNAFGSTAAAAFGVGIRVDQFSSLPSMSLGFAVSSLVGQNLGAGRDDRVREVVRISSLVGSSLAVSLALVVLLFAPSIASLFVSDPSVVEESASYLRHNAFNYLPFALMFVLAGVFRGAGDTLPTVLFTFLAMWGFRVPVAYLLAFGLRMGTRGIWTAMALSPYLSLLVQYLYYRSGLWRRRAALRRLVGAEVFKL